MLLLCLATVGAGVAAGVGWYYSNQLLAVSHAPDPYTLRVAGIGRGNVTLSHTDAAERPGVYGLVWHGGAAVLGAVAATTADTVTRRLLSGAVPPVGTKARLDTDVWLTDPQQARGLRYEDVSVPNRLGPMPAWLVPGTKRTWVVAVHGRGGTRREALRILPALHRAGVPVLDISYRNDVGAPREPDGRDHLGDTQWRDVEAAVRYAEIRGAHRIVLYGWSMGAALVAAFLQRSAYADRVTGVVLDAPVIDWRATLDLQGDNRNLPRLLTAVAAQVVHLRIGIDWGEFNLDDTPSRVTVPTLVFFGEDDHSVPIEPARRLADRSPNVTFVSAPWADHTQEWNVDPPAYEARVIAFLRTVAA